MILKKVLGTGGRSMSMRTGDLFPSQCPRLQRNCHSILLKRPFDGKLKSITSQKR
jgi:hypothetical protein